MSHVPFSCWAGVCSAVLEVHVGTGSVFSVEGQRVVLPAWYTSRSQKKPYVTWLLDKADADPFQVTGGTEWGGAYGAFNMGDACVAHNVGGCPHWGGAHNGEMSMVPTMVMEPTGRDAHAGELPMMERCLGCP